MKKITTGLLAVLALLAFYSCSNSTGGGSGDAVDLKLNLEKGKTYNYILKTHTDMAGEGMPGNSGMDMDMGYKLKVDDVDASGNRVMSTSYDAIKFMISGDGKEMGYDSKNTADTGKKDMMSQMFRMMFSGMLGKSFKMTMTPKGEIVKMEGVKEMINSMTEGMKLPAQAKEQVKTQLEQTMSEDKMKESFARGFNIYPDKPVKAGDQWTKSYTQDISGNKVVFDVTYTVKEIKNDVVLLDVNGTISDSKEEIPAGGASNTGTQKGTMELSRTTGLPQKAELNMDMQVKASTSAKPMNMKMKMMMEGN